MEEILYDEIPSLDLDDFYSTGPNGKKDFVARLGTAFRTIGFVAVRNHFLDNDLQARLYDAIRKFFALPDDVKLRYERRDLAGQRGYTGKGKEHAKGRHTGDLKEFYHIGQELPSNLQIKEGYPANIWPHEVAEFKAVTTEAYRALEKTGSVLLRAIALFLDLPENYFDDKIASGNSILRHVCMPLFFVASSVSRPIASLRSWSGRSGS